MNRDVQDEQDKIEMKILSCSSCTSLFEFFSWKCKQIMLPENKKFADISEEPDLSRESSGSSEYLRTGLG